MSSFRGRTLLHFLLWKLGLAHGETQTTEAERDCLSKHAAGKKTLAEIGVWHGVTTLRLRKAMAPDAVLLAIDPYQTGSLGFSIQQSISHKDTAKSNNGTIQWCRTTGEQAGKDQAMAGKQESFDFVFIDGDHSYDGLKVDWENWKPLIAKGGIVGLHDSRSSGHDGMEDVGSVRYTSEVVLRDPDFSQIDAVDSLTVMRRN